MRISVVIPVYKSSATILRCLSGLQQLECAPFEVIFVDSSPDDSSSEIIRRFPQYKLARTKERLLMHAARNMGVQAAEGDVIAFTDPDCVVASDWLTEVEESIRGGHAVVGGGIALFPGTSTDIAAHIVKFWRWFPGGGDRFIEDLPTANFAVRTDALRSVGLFKGDLIAGDTELSHRLREAGYNLFFNSRALVHHIHEATFVQLIRERFTRGVDFGQMRTMLSEWSTWKSCAAILAAPLLALRQVYWQCRACMTHDYLLGGFFRTLPVIVCCDYAWVFGAALGYITTIARGSKTHRPIDEKPRRVS